MVRSSVGCFRLSSLIKILHYWFHRGDVIRSDFWLVLYLIVYVILMNFTNKIINVYILSFLLLSKLLFLHSEVVTIKFSYFMNVFCQHLIDQIIINFPKLWRNRGVILQGFILWIWRGYESTLVEFFDYSLFKLAFHVLSLLLHRGVPMILDWVVSSTV